MSVLGFFRRNTTMVIWIMVGLMVAFVLSTVPASQWRALFGMKDETNALAELENYDTVITASDVATASQQFRVYQDFGIGDAIRAVIMVKSGNVPVGDLMMMLTQAKAVEQQGMLVGIEAIGGEQGAVNWAMLTAEAKAQGFRADGAAVDSFLNKQGLLDDNMQPVAHYKNMLADFRKNGLLESQLRSYIADYLAVVACFENSVSGIVRPEQQLRKQFVDVNAKMNIALASYDAGNFVSEIDIDESDEAFKAELKAMFDEGKLYFRDAADNPTKYRFGYRLPQRVQLEYAYISLDAVSAEVQLSDEEIYKFWNDNPDRFKKQEKNDEGEMLDVETTYADVKSDVRKALRSQRAMEKAKMLADTIIRNASDLQDNEDAAIAGAAMATAVEKASSAAVKYNASGDWLSAESISDDALLGSASSMTTRMPLNYAVFNVDAFVEDSRTTSYKVGRVCSQPFMTRSPSGFVVWRVTGAKDSQAPEEMTAEIEAQVRSDWILTKAYELAASKAAQAALEISKDSLKDVAGNDDIEPVEIKDLTRRERRQYWGNYRSMYAAQSAFQLFQWSQGGAKGERPEMLSADLYYEAALSQPYVWDWPMFRELGNLTPAERKAVADAAFSLAIEGENTTETPAPAGTVTTVELPGSRKVVVVQALSYSPAFEDDFSGENGQRESILKLEIAAEKLSQLKKWCSQEDIEARSGFKSLLFAETSEDKDSDTEPSDADGEDAAEPASAAVAN